MQFIVTKTFAVEAETLEEAQEEFKKNGGVGITLSIQPRPQIAQPPVKRP